MLINGFNEACKNISDSYLKVGDESTSAIRFRTTAKGILHRLSYMLRKSEPLWTELKIVVFSVTGDLLFIEAHIVKEGMKHSKYHQYLGVILACTKRMVESTKKIGQNYIKGATKDRFIFYSWLSSKRLAEYAMDVGASFIGVVKTNTKG